MELNYKSAKNIEPRLKPYLAQNIFLEDQPDDNTKISFFTPVFAFIMLVQFLTW